MKREGKSVIFSPSDLVVYMQSPFATWMNRYALDCPEDCPAKDPDDPLMSYLAQKGIEHEAAFLAELEREHPGLVKIDDRQSVEKRKAKTIQAMSAGAPVIFQACLELDNFRGYADFLVKVDEPSKLGSFSYVPWDTKLSKNVKPYFLIQLCCYAELLEGVQGLLPASFSVVLGNKQIESFKTADYFDFYAAKKGEFLEQQSQFDVNNMPNPFDYSEHGNWTHYVESLRTERDHLSQVANITRNQIAKLNAAGIATFAALATTDLVSIRKLDDRIFDRLKQQARIQKDSLSLGKTQFELLKNDSVPKTGLALLPPSNSGDLFWDLEGYPLEEGGLEYLWGCTYFDETNTRQFWERWAHDHQAEKQAFIDFILFAFERWKSNPGMRIYHYGHYEISVCQRLMGRYGVCEHEVDELLRHQVFVDLYKIVRYGILLGEPKYSIKNVEHLYRGTRDTEVASGGESVVVYANWREAPDGLTWQDSLILKNIRDYNIDDCDSTQELTAWLREQQVNNGILYEQEEDSVATTVDYVPTAADLIERGLLLKSEDQSLDTATRYLATQLAHLIKFHKRENKPMWWRLFERQGMDYAQLYDDPDCLVDCRRADKEPFLRTTRSRNLCYEYQYDPNQEFRNRRFQGIYILGDQIKKAKVEEVDTTTGTFTISTSAEPPDCFDAIADEYVPAEIIEKSIQKIGKEFSENGRLPKPLKEFLLRECPDVPGELLLKIDQLDGQPRLAHIIKAIAQLNHSTISIQGPPGTGKTYTAKHIILALLRLGKTIGITSNSHKAINNLMFGVAELLKEEHERFPLIKIQSEEDPIFKGTAVQSVGSNGAIAQCICNGGSVVGATAWGFAREDAKVDYLFIDEAGQVSLANFVAMSTQAHNIICLGDQMQLPQPLQGSHPGDSGMSILDYALAEHATIPAHMGIFLNRTYRMHSAVNAFISEGVYESRLANDPACDQQQIILSQEAKQYFDKGVGISFFELDHVGNKQVSIEEIAFIDRLVQALGQCQWRDKAGTVRDLTPNDVMIVAPFNYQVNELLKVVGNRARVGTVDKFQGQEAPVVILSMAASLASESARGADFLLNKNRINVAISRAQAMAVVVASLTLLDGAPNKLSDILQYNLFYKLKRYGKRRWSSPA